MLPKIRELRHIARLTNAVVIRISESKLDDSMPTSEIQIDEYDLLRCDRNRHGGGVACYIRNDLSYNVKSYFPKDIENIFFELLLPNTKPIVVGTITHQTKQILWRFLMKTCLKLTQIKLKLTFLVTST